MHGQNQRTSGRSAQGGQYRVSDQGPKTDSRVEHPLHQLAFGHGFLPLASERRGRPRPIGGRPWGPAFRRMGVVRRSFSYS